MDRLQEAERVCRDGMERDGDELTRPRLHYEVVTDQPGDWCVRLDFVLGKEYFVTWFRPYKPIWGSQTSDILISSETFGTASTGFRGPVVLFARKGKVIVEQRADGSLHIRFKTRHLSHHVLEEACQEGDREVMGALPPGPRRLRLSRSPQRTGRPGQRTRPGISRPGLMRCIGPPDARFALLRSPVLPHAETVVVGSSRGVERQTIPGVDGRRRKPDISIGRQHRTFLSALDRGHHVTSSALLEIKHSHKNNLRCLAWNQPELDVNMCPAKRAVVRLCALGHVPPPGGFPQHAGKPSDR